MAALDFNALMANAGTAPDFSPLTPGPYPARVEAAEAKSTSTGKKMYSLTFVVESGPSAGRKQWTNFVISPESATSLAINFRQMAALGVDATFLASLQSMDEASQDAYMCAKFVDARCQIVVGVRKDDPSRTEVKDVKPPADAPIVPTAPAQPLAAPPVAVPTAPVAPVPQVPVAPVAPVAPVPQPAPVAHVAPAPAPATGALVPPVAPAPPVNPFAGQ